jgi:phage repressor protein C with HTH and peptisase S24 domain
MPDPNEDELIPAEPLKRRLEPRGAKAEFARHFDITQAVLTNWFSRGIPARRLRAVCSALGISVDQYRSEAGLAPESYAPAAVPAYPHYAVRETPLPFTPRLETVEVPVFNVAASMGLGASMPEHETVVDHLRLTRSWVSRNLPGANGSQTLSVLSAYGDSMQPTFNDGDILLVDTSISELRLDAVYVLAFHGELYIKRIQRRPDGSIAIISDNKVYDPIIVAATDKETVRVLGRVLWAWNGKRL